MDLTAKYRSIAGCGLTADVARTFGEVRLRVTGSSMIPAIWPGDVITVHRRSITELRPGMIVLCERNTTLVAHRVTNSYGTFLTTRGDSLPSEDPAVGASEIVGEVVCVDRDGRPVSLRQTAVRHAMSFILQRSEGCRRMALRMGLRILRLSRKEVAWAK